MSWDKYGPFWARPTRPNHSRPSISDPMVSIAFPWYKMSWNPSSRSPTRPAAQTPPASSSEADLAVPILAASPPPAGCAQHRRPPSAARIRPSAPPSHRSGPPRPDPIPCASFQIPSPSDPRPSPQPLYPRSSSTSTCSSAAWSLAPPWPRPPLLFPSWGGLERHVRGAAVWGDAAPSPSSWLATQAFGRGWSSPRSSGSTVGWFGSCWIHVAWISPHPAPCSAWRSLLHEIDTKEWRLLQRKLVQISHIHGGGVRW